MNSNFEDCLKALGKEQSSKNVYKILYNIRKEVEWPKNKENFNKIRREGTMKHFIAILQSPHKHIVDVCLSILGNLFLDKDCARDAVGIYDVLSALTKVLKRFEKEDNIIGRSYKAIGNLCQQVDDCAIAIINKSPAIMTHLYGVLKSSVLETSDTAIYSELTIIMIIRALRYLTNQLTTKHLIVRFPILPALGGVFIKYCNKWKEDKSHEKLLEMIIDIFYVFSKLKNYNVINALKSTEAGNALEKLADLLTLNNRKIMKIIMNLIETSKFKSDLPVPEIIKKFVEEIFVKYVDTENGEFNIESFQYIHCLCYLFDHPANRNGYQCAKVIPLLVKVLGKVNSPTSDQLQCCILLVNTLNKCKYEENLLQEQLKCNILDIAIKKLRLLANDNDFHANHTKRKLLKRKFPVIKMMKFAQGVCKEAHKKKRRFSCMDCSNGSCGFHGTSFTPSPTPVGAEEQCRLRQFSPLSPSSSDDELNYCTNFFTRSPSPCSSSSSDYAGMSWPSPCSSPSSLNTDPAYSDSDDYSPVCSEADSTEYPLNTNIDEGFGIIDKLSEIFEEQEQYSFDHSAKDDNVTFLKKRLIYSITKLLRSYAKIQPPVPQLGSEDLLSALINLTELFIDGMVDNISSTLLAILHSPVYLIPLLKTPFIENISKLTEFTHEVNCDVCVCFYFIAKVILRQLTELAEGAVGKGDLAHELLRGSDDVRIPLMLSIPYFIENKSILSKLLINCGGFKILMDLVRRESIYRNRSIKSICILSSRRLKIANPKKIAMKLHQSALEDNIKQSENPINVVTFKLDDGMCIKADRDYWTKKSDYFSSLLSGHFKESNEDEVHLHNVKSETLNCLLELVTSKDVLHKADIDTLLDVISLSDRYLMSDICCFVTNFVEKHKISFVTVPTIYRWSLESGLNLLRVESIAYALVAKIVDDDRFSMFNSLFALGYSEELFDDIEKLILRYLTSCQTW